MIGKRYFDELITAKEVVELCSKNGTIDEMMQARAIFEEYERTVPKEPKDPNWWFYCMLATIYEGGRIQGIREERQRIRDKRTVHIMNRKDIE